MRHFTRSQLDRAFHPRAIAVVGAKKAGNYTWLKRFQAYQAKHGQLFAVHTNPESAKEIESLGIKCYPSVADIPAQVDYVTCTVPRRVAVDVFTQCIQANVAAVSYFTSGFAEYDEEGAQLQQQLAKLSRESGVALIGPNGMGFYNPAIHMPTGLGMPLGEAGPLGMVSQSGTHHSFFIKTLFASHGIRTARGVSLGNAAALDPADWMEYIGESEDVKVLASYVEGIGSAEAGDHERYIKAVKSVVAKKPVIIWKGGNTTDGARVTSAHTGAAAISPEAWARVLEQSGAVGVNSMEALVDTAAMLVKLPRLSGPNCGLVILTGGQGIAITDTFGRHGLRVPELSENSLQELGTFFDPIGGSFHNPLDAAYATETPAMLARELDILDRDPKIDFVAMDLFHLIMNTRRIQSSWGLDEPPPGKHVHQGDSFLDVMTAHARRAKKPFFVIVTAGDAEAEGLALRELLKARGVLAFASAERAAIAYATALKVWKQRGQA
jgi:acyl-CoA synthetase (NDP forming)